MMPKRQLDPFHPQRPISDPEHFSGRVDQVEEVVDALYQLHGGQPRHVVITGPRGIGKSSLLLQTKHLAKGDSTLADRLSIDTGVASYNFAHAWHDVDTGQGPKELVEGLLRDLRSQTEKIWSSIELRLDIGPVAVSEDSATNGTTLSELVRRFCDKAIKAAEAAADDGRDGLIFFVDELDRASTDQGIASFFKLAIERLNRADADNIAFFGAGITGAIQRLEEEHASIYRSFYDIPLPLLEGHETAQILKDGFDQSGLDFEANVPDKVHRTAGGYPEPVHLLGSHMIKTDEDNYIGSDDFDRAKKKIVRSVRRNQLKTILESAGSGKYQRILRAMANHDAPAVPLSVISESIGEEQPKYSTNMRNLIDRDIIKRVDLGVYKFREPLLKVYIREFGVISPQTEPEETA